MCLVTSHFNPRITNRDTVCYKRLCYHWYSTSPYCTPYFVYPCTIGTTIKSKFPLDIKDLESYSGPRIGYFCVGGEGVHAYTNLYSAYESSCVDEVIAVCYIPKGTKYYLGIDNDIAAERMVISRIISKDEIKKQLSCI